MYASEEEIRDMEEASLKVSKMIADAIERLSKYPNSNFITNGFDESGQGITIFPDEENNVSKNTTHENCSSVKVESSE